MQVGLLSCFQRVETEEVIALLPRNIADSSRLLAMFIRLRLLYDALPDDDDIRTQ